MHCATGFTSNVWIGLKKSKTSDHVYRTFNIELTCIHLPDVCAHQTRKILNVKMFYKIANK